jgi:transposase
MFARIKKSGLYEYLQLVENHRYGGKVVQRVIGTMGRKDHLCQKKLESLLKSIERFSENTMLLIDKANKNIRSRFFKIGPSLIFERLWTKTGIREVLKDLLRGRKFDFDVERAIFLAVLNRLFAPGSDRATDRWRENYRIEGCSCDALSLHHLYRAMAWLGEVLDKNQQDGATPFSPRCIKDIVEEELFDRRRALFSELNLIFLDTTSLYFEGLGGQTLGKLGKSKEHRSDHRQMIVGVILDGNGIPICCELWPGNVCDVKTLIPIVNRMRDRFGIGKVCIVADRGMISEGTVNILESEKYDLNYILGVRMRNQKEVRENVIGNIESLEDFQEIYPCRLKSKDPSPLKIKEVNIENKRYVVCFNEEQARKDAYTRQAIIEDLMEKIKSNVCSLIGNKGYRKYISLCHENFKIDEEKVKSDERYDGLWVLRTNTNLSAVETALRYKDLWRVERIFRETKSLLRTRPIFHKYDETIRGHVFCSFLALVIRKELERKIEESGYIFEWADIKRDLESLVETEISYKGKTFIVRSECQGTCGKIFQVVGVAVPPTIRRA